MAFKSKHEHISKKKDICTHLPRAFYFCVIEADLEVIQFSYFLGIIRTLNAQLLKYKKKRTLVDV